MITEDYVSFETTKLLKEKGFDLSEFHGKWVIDYDNIPHDENNTEGEIIITEYHYPLITLQMAMKWLREEHNIHVVPKFDFYAGYYTGRIYDGRRESTAERDDYIAIVGNSTHEQACNEAIKYCLENLIGDEN